ncbi:MAG: hypothetical protein Q8L77_04085 [Nitrospirota bacterium]|nr:hypothetical protein [Nitrospirota bacterium]
MTELDKFLQSIDRPEKSVATISKILSALKPQVLLAWLAKAAVKDRKIAGTYYAEIENNLSAEEFVALYEALGYDFKSRDIWRDWWCYGSVGCTRQSGYTCNTGTCT